VARGAYAAGNSRTLWRTSQPRLMRSSSKKRRGSDWSSRPKRTSSVGQPAPLPVRLHSTDVRPGRLLLRTRQSRPQLVHARCLRRRQGWLGPTKTKPLSALGRGRGRARARASSGLRPKAGRPASTGQGGPSGPQDRSALDQESGSQVDGGEEEGGRRDDGGRVQRKVEQGAR
jgi:hypothetical protein